MDCLASLAMTERQRICFAAVAMTGRAALLRHCLRQTRSVCARERSDEAIQPLASCFAEPVTGSAALLRHCEERSDEAIHSFLWHGLLRCARNDGEVPPSLRGAQRRSNPFFL